MAWPSSWVPSQAAPALSHRQGTRLGVAGYPPEEVVGVRFDQGSFAVHVAESLSRAESERIFEELRRP